MSQQLRSGEGVVKLLENLLYDLPLNALRQAI